MAGLGSNFYYTVMSLLDKPAVLREAELNPWYLKWRLSDPVLSVASVLPAVNSDFVFVAFSSAYRIYSSLLLE